MPFLCDECEFKRERKDASIALHPRLLAHKACMTTLVAALEKMTFICRNTGRNYGGDYYMSLMNGPCWDFFFSLVHKLHPVATATAATQNQHNSTTTQC